MSLVRSLVRPLVAALAIALVAAASAAAVTGSAPDGDAHPYVGALVVDGAVTCSGVLVAPAVFATAGHCTAAVPPGADVRVTFDSALDESRWTLHAGTAHTHPRLRNGDDLGVVVLDSPVSVAPALLPEAGAVAGVGGSVTSVGYGYHLAADGTFAYDGVRRAAESPVLDVKKALLRMSTKAAGPCHGDSGGPQLRGDVVLSLTSAGANDCSGKAEGYRLDTAAARSFLGGFVALP